MPALEAIACWIVISPNTPGYVGDIEIAAQLSEIGVMLLMFGVGLHFSLNDLLAVKRIAVPVVIVQMTVATVLGTIMAMSWGNGLSGVDWCWVFLYPARVRLFYYKP